MGHMNEDAIVVEENNPTIKLESQVDVNAGNLNICLAQMMYHTENFDVLYNMLLFFKYIL